MIINLKYLLYIFTIILLLNVVIAKPYTPKNSVDIISDEDKSGCYFGSSRADCSSCKSSYQMDCAYYFYSNPSDCTNLGAYRNSCVKMIHKENNLKNDKIQQTCSYIEGEYWHESDCITELLYRNLESIADVKYCNLISNDEEQFRRDGCIKFVVLNQSTKKGDAQYCMDIKHLDHLRTDCYEEMAIKYNDAKTCGSIDTSTNRILGCCLKIEYPKLYDEYSKLGFNSEKLFDFYDQNANEIEDCKAITDLAGPEILTFCEKLNCDCTKPLNELVKTDPKLAEEIAVECVLERYDCYMEHRTLSHPEMDEAVSIQGLGGWNRQHCHRMFDFPSIDGFIDWSKWSSWTYVPEPRYPLYDTYFDYDGDGMLNEYEYKDYLASQKIVTQNFDSIYEDEEKIEYMDLFKMPPISNNKIPANLEKELEEAVIEGGEISEEKNPDVVTRFDLPNLFSQVNMYESELLKMSDMITYEVSNIAEQIDRDAKTIVTLNSSLMIYKGKTGANVDEQLKQLKEQEKSLEGTYFRKGKLEDIKAKIKELENNKDAIKQIEERIITTQKKIQNQTQRQVELINKIDEEYRTLVSKFDEDIKKADSDFTAIPMQDLRQELIENAQYAKVTAYFHSGNTKEFEKLANKLKITNRDHGAEIAILLGLKKLEKGDPQSALHDFKEAMAIDPNNAVAREITNKIEGNYLNRIEDKLMKELEGDKKSYEASSTKGGPGAFNVVKDILTTGIASSSGALFGYEEAKAIESGLLQTDASKQIAGIKISKALMGDGMTLKELYELKKPEDIQKLAQSRGRDITLDQAKKYREMIHAALDNKDVSGLKQNSYFPLEVDSHRSYFNTNYDPGLTANVLDVINVKNVIMTLGPSAIVGTTKAGKAITAKDYIRDISGLSKFQKAVLSGKIGTESGKVGKLFATTSARFGKELKIISEYGYVRQTAIKQGFSYLEGKVVEGTSKAILGNDTGAIFTDLYKGVAAFTGFNDLGDMIDITKTMDVKEFNVEFRNALKEGVVDKSTLVTGKGIANEKHRIATQAKELDTSSTKRALEKSLNDKKSLEVSDLNKLKEELARQTKELQDNSNFINTKAAFLKQSEIDSLNNAIVAYESGHIDVVHMNLGKATNMQNLLDKEIGDLAVQKEIASYLYDTAEHLNLDEKVSSITDLIKEKPLSVGKLNIPQTTIDLGDTKKTIGGQLDVLMEFGNSDSGWQSIIEGGENSNSLKIAKSIGLFNPDYYFDNYKNVDSEIASLSLKAIEKSIGDFADDGLKLYDKATNELAIAVNLPNSNKFMVKVQEDNNNSTRAVVNNALIISDDNFNKHVDSKRYIMIK
jgi:hypothetical protein